ncbi:hypothetical protein G5V59_12180 [Nocardioides sp. W3-2-3]|uniref:hypothetical protein n=1 Tax=Nocardioides convexus TaxID=2712224 RepID=UPI00241814CD|nr:hypothetical protein [Nocardioides convexus]NHA00528.1 hypothetical protein [Nocardioides convexus]
MTLLWDDQTRLGELRVGRRSTIVAGLAGASIPALGVMRGFPGLVENRRDLTTGVRSGEVTTRLGDPVVARRRTEPDDGAPAHRRAPAGPARTVDRPAHRPHRPDAA